MDSLELKPFPNVSANALATLTTDELLGYSIHALIFELGGTTFDKSHIDEVTIRAGGKDIIEKITGSQLQSLNSYDGFTNTTDYLIWWFGDPSARTIRGQHLGDLDMSIYGGNPLEIMCDIGAATAPTLQVHALVGAPKLAMGLGFNEVDAAVVRAMTFTQLQPAAAVSRKAYPIGLGSEAGARVRKIAFFHSNLTSIEFKKSGDIKHDNVSDALNNFIQAEFARSPQSGLYVLDRTADGNQGEAETTLRSDGRPWPMQLRLTTSAADTIDVFADIHTAIPLL